jgi:tight adherence protein B
MASALTPPLWSWWPLLGTAAACALLAWVLLHIGSHAWHQYRLRFHQRTQFQARELFLLVEPDQWLLLHAAAMACTGVLAWAFSGNGWLALLLVALLAPGPQILYRYWRRHRRQQMEAQWPDSLLLMCGAMRAGASVQTALQQVAQDSPAPLRQELGLVLHAQRLGVPWQSSLSHLAQRMPTPGTTLVVSAMHIAHDTGGNLAETLERTAHTLQARQQMAAKIDSLTAQGRLQAWVVGLLPVGLLVVLQGMDPVTMGQLWHTPLGWATLSVMVISEALGLYLIRRIVHFDI